MTPQNTSENTSGQPACLEHRLAATERRLARAERRLGATWALAFVGTLGAFVLGLNPEARAQFGVTLSSLNNRLTLTEARVTAAERRIAQFDLAALLASNRLSAVETKMQFVSVSGGEMFVTGTNLHIRNGSGATNGNPANPFASNATSVNGLGNLIVGYNEVDFTFGDNRGGSHNLVIGVAHDYTSFGGLVAGRFNRIAGPGASVSGGSDSEASGFATSVSGGFSNEASGENTSVSGGQNNTASGNFASVSGGAENLASGPLASVSGGRSNAASGFYDSVSGGWDNAANGFYNSVSGGRNNTASGPFGSSVSGGNSRASTGTDDWRAGSLFQDF